MKLGPRLLVEIMNVVQTSLVSVLSGDPQDVSDLLRDIDVEVDGDVVELSSYIQRDS